MWQMLGCARCRNQRLIFSAARSGRKLPIFPGNCPSWRKHPCSRSWSPTSSDWLKCLLSPTKTVLKIHPGFRLPQGPLRSLLSLHHSSPSPFSSSCLVTSLSQGWVPRILYPPSPGMLVFTPGSVSSVMKPVVLRLISDLFHLSLRFCLENENPSRIPYVELGCVFK